jgi:hypothetical protein
MKQSPIGFVYWDKQQSAAPASQARGAGLRVDDYEGK